MRFQMSDVRLQIARASVIAGLLALGMATTFAQQKPADPKDPRIGLKPGLRDAGVAAMGLELVATRPRPEGFFDPKAPAGAITPSKQGS